MSAYITDPISPDEPSDGMLARLEKLFGEKVAELR